MNCQEGTRLPEKFEHRAIIQRVLCYFLTVYISAQKNISYLTILLLTILLIVCGATAFVGVVPTRIYGHDNFFLLDNGWRILCGQRPHLDFFSPWGPVTFLVVGMGLGISGTSANGIGYANAIVGFIIGTWAILISHNRLHSILRIILLIYLTLLVTSPYALGNSPFLSSHAMVYNRYGYALLGLIIVECFLKNKYMVPYKGDFADGISTGAIVAITLFLKASYFIISLMIVAASLFLRRASYKRHIGLLIGFCIVFLAMLVYLRFDIWAIFEALYMAAGARSESLHLKILPFQVISQAPSFIAMIAISSLCIRYIKAENFSISNYKWVIMLFFIFVSDSLLMLTNALQIYSMPLLGIFAILIANQVIKVQQKISFTKEKKYLYDIYVLLLLSSMFIAPQVALDIVGLATGVYQKATNPSTTEGQIRFTEPHLNSMLLYDGSFDTASNGSVYTRYVNDGVDLLKKYCSASDRVLTMDMVNPFPYAMKWRPPKGGTAAISFNYTLSKKYRPSFNDYFGDATIVLLPKHPAQSHCFSAGFYELYIPVLIERFQLYAESDLFWLYKRK